jgi:spoIIIJ-associated protein
MDERVVASVKEVLTAAQLPFTDIEVTEVIGQTVYNIKTDDGRFLIGQRGDTIRAIDHLVKKFSERKGVPELTFMIDASGYRTEKIKELQSKVLMMAERARALRYDVELAPMGAYERLIVHTTVADMSDVKSESQGEGRDRRVIIRYIAE